MKENRMNFRCSVIIFSFVGFINYPINASFVDKQYKKSKLINTYVLAARAGDLETVQRCVSQGVEINAVNPQNSDNTTALIEAACQGHDHVVKFLLKIPGIDLTIKSKRQFTALSAAAYMGHESIVKLILDQKDVDLQKQVRTAFGHAAQQGHDSIAKLLLHYPSFDINYRNEWGNTVLMWLAAHNYENMAKFVLQFPDLIINARNLNGENAYYTALKTGRDGIAHLIKNKIDELTLKAFQAIDRNDIQILKQIIGQIGSDIIDADGKTLIDRSFSAHKPEIALFLLNNAKDPREQLARFPFELINPTSELFKLCMELGYNADQKNITKTCANCSQEYCNKKCSRCKKVFYCSDMCQKEHWKTHKQVCKES